MKLSINYPYGFTDHNHILYTLSSKIFSTCNPMTETNSSTTQ